jgi:MYXO-CTERM domain-containing protein
MMANAARDPVFFAALSIANQDSPVLGNFCLRCHSPLGYVRGHTTSNDGSDLDEIDLQGVGCDTCHRMAQSLAPDDPYVLGNAQIVYDNDQGKRGKYDDAVSPAHETTPDIGVLEPRFCGQCHQVSNPEMHMLDVNGLDTGIEFPFETTFEEWQSSTYAVPGPASADCVDCHMVKLKGDFPLAKGVLPKLRTDPRKHTFTGGNHWGIRAVMEANPERADKYPEAFQNALQSTLDTLESAVTVTLVTAPGRVSPGEPFDVTVKVENLTGHKFPTGYVDARQAWIAVTFVDCEGNEQAVLGGYDSESGAVQSEPPTHIYRAIHGRWDGTKGVEELSLARQNMHLSDTRIPPKGFVASPSMFPSDEITYTDGQGGWNNFDEATFSLTAPTALAGTQTLSARVYFQPMRREYIEYLRAANTTDQKGEELWTIYQNTEQSPPILIAKAETTVTAPGECTIGTGGNGGGSATGGNGGTSTGGNGDGLKESSPDSEGGGCTCRTKPTPIRSPILPLAVAVAAAALLRRRRRCPTAN